MTQRLKMQLRRTITWALQHSNEYSVLITIVWMEWHWEPTNWLQVSKHHVWTHLWTHYDCHLAWPFTKRLLKSISVLANYASLMFSSQPFQPSSLAFCFNLMYKNAVKKPFFQKHIFWFGFYSWPIRQKPPLFWVELFDSIICGHVYLWWKWIKPEVDQPLLAVNHIFKLWKLLKMF